MKGNTQYAHRSVAIWDEEGRISPNNSALASSFQCRSSDGAGARALTSEALAREYREEFRQDFEQYFSDTLLYLRCLETEHSEVMIEVNETAARYNQFLKDSQQWVQE